MNWYKRYPADFVVKTRHLTMTEIGAYNLLLDYYYAAGEPLSDDITELYRVAAARTRAEKRAVERVVEEFFPANGDGRRHNKRADKEIAKANDISSKRAAAGSKGGSK